MGETKEVMPVNKKAKDRLFTKIYESEENLRSLVGFLMGEDIGDIEIRNVEPVIFGNKENDLAFICNESIYIMMEEQSYHCANIAYRILEYITAALRSTVDSEQMLYGSTLVKFPVPKLYVTDVGIVRDSSKLSEVEHDIYLRDSFLKAKLSGEKEITPDLDLTVHAYDFRMTYDEALRYIERNEKPERFEKYNTELFQYALAANSITYIQRTISNERLKKPKNVNDVAEVIKLLTERGILLKEFAKKEVCDMTVAQFSRDDILKYGAREEGREEGSILGTIKTLEDLDYSDLQIVGYLIDKCKLEKEEAERYVLSSKIEQ